MVLPILGLIEIVVFKKKIHDGSQRILGANYSAKGKAEMSTNQFSSEVSRKELCIMIVVHEYPLSIVDHLYFKRFCCSLNPLFKGFEKSKMQKIIDQNKGRIAITTKMWTASNQERGYMAVTAHYIDNGWKLRNHLVMFGYLPAPHTSQRLAVRLSQCLLDWNIDSRLSTITVDHCTTNDSMINLVKQKLVLSNLIRDGTLLHMRCSAHILNLIVKDGLDVLKDGIENIRESVGFWTCTLRRVEYFHENAQQLKLTVSTKLVLDCPTRWNSTYDMLSAAIPYKDVFSRLKCRESQYNSVPTKTQWEFAAIVCEKLAVFKDITEVFFGSNYPTANQFFPKVCELRLRLLEWLGDPNPMIVSMAEKMWNKFAKYWDDIHLLLVVAVVLDPRYKLDLVEYYATRFGIDSTDLVAERVKSVVADLVMEYQRKSPKNTSVSLTCAPSSSSTDLDFDRYVRQRKKIKTFVVTTELDHYLAEDVHPRTEDFDLLGWWKFSGAKCPILQDITRDLLVVPVTSVASESAFSSGGRLLDPHRSRLLPATVEAMMVLRSWIQDDSRGKCSFSIMITLSYLDSDNYIAM
ncbi:Putative AC transposase [Linum grandiflorum]